jgi:hypothetical protein
MAGRAPGDAAGLRILRKIQLTLHGRRAAMTDVGLPLPRAPSAS